MARRLSTIPGTVTDRRYRDQMTDTGETDAPLIPTYSRGTWTPKPFPIPGYGGDFGDYAAFLRKGGYAQFTAINEGGNSLTLNVWQWVGSHGPIREGQARFLIDIDSPCASDVVAAMDVVDMMDVLAQWAPAVEASVFGDLWEAAQYNVTLGLEYNRFAAIGALVAEGAEQRGRWSSQQRARAAERRERAQVERETGRDVEGQPST